MGSEMCIRDRLMSFQRHRRQDDVSATYSKSRTTSRTTDGSCDKVCNIVDSPKSRLLTVTNSTLPQQRSQRSSNEVAQPQPPVTQSSDAVSQLFRLPLKSNVATTQVRADIAARGSEITEHEEASVPLMSTADAPSQLRRPADSKLEDDGHQRDAPNDIEADQSALSDVTAADGRDAAHDPSTEITPVPDCPPYFVGERRPAMTLHRVALQACMAAKLSQAVRDRRERKRHQQEKKAERKAAKTLSAVLLAFIVTWTPYNVFIIVEAFCTDCVNPTLYAIGT